MDKKIVIILNQADGHMQNFEYLREKIGQTERAEMSFLFYDAKEQTDILRNIRTMHPDLLITTDLQGFEQCTLTDNIAFNLADCKQLHLLLHEDLPNESYLGKQLSIAMFFYCVGNAYYDELNSRYPELPYLKKLEGWQDATGKQAMEQNAAILCSVIKEVLNA